MSETVVCGVTRDHEETLLLIYFFNFTWQTIHFLYSYRAKYSVGRSWHTVFDEVDIIFITLVQFNYDLKYLIKLVNFKNSMNVTVDCNMLWTGIHCPAG